MKDDTTNRNIYDHSLNVMVDHQAVIVHNNNVDNIVMDYYKNYTVDDPLIIVNHYLILVISQIVKVVIEILVDYEQNLVDVVVINHCDDVNKIL